MKIAKYSVLDPVDIPELALDVMNKTHQEEVELINQLGDLLGKMETKGTVPDTFSSKLDEWVTHTRMHFLKEENLMQEYGFPAYSFHKSEHDRVLKHVEELVQQWLKSKNIQPLAEFIFHNWPRWFNDHVNTMDRVTAEFLSQRGA